jgi:uncharacterized protein involved in exopolysaccharide biosynthesis
MERTKEQIQAELDKAYSSYRYYTNTDSLNTYERERAQREEAKDNIKRLEAELKAVGREQVRR